MGHFTALFDACVLYPAPLRDLLLHLAATRLYRARWTNAIHDEWIQKLVKNRPDLKAENLQRTRELMDASVPDCLINNYENLIGVLEMPDPDDRHVLAAAIKGKVDVIVTSNLKDFPESVLKAHDIQAEHPDEFITHLIDLRPGAVYDAVKKQRALLHNPTMTVDDLLLRFESLELRETTAKLRAVAELL